MTKNKNQSKKTKKKWGIKPPRFVVGVDEVGRGPVAGPVYVCAVLMTESGYRKFKKSSDCRGLRDSKALSEQKREVWFKKIKDWRSDGMLDYVFSSAPAEEIDNIGISKTIKKCLNQNLKKLDVPEDAVILLDGSLFAPPQFSNQETIVKGDELEPIISLASIVAKVSRDNYMVKIAKKYPKYLFETHKGYGTKKHLNLMKKFGLSKLHRRTFLGKYL